MDRDQCPACSPALRRWLLLGAVTVGLLAQGVLAVSPDPRSRVLVRAPGSGWDNGWPCQRQLVRAHLRVCVPVCPRAAPTKPRI
ncbi:hypothetical protein MC885_005437 [Smutsia gigantea]|nr:hypothetical protein MC885_005437 [Smutsia gigantea]